MSKICTFNPTGNAYNLPLLKMFLRSGVLHNVSDLQQLGERLDNFWNKQLQGYLNDSVSNLIDTFFKLKESPERQAAIVLELEEIVNFLCVNILLSASPSEDVKSDVALGLTIVLLFCRYTDAKELGIRVIQRYARCRGIDWSEPSLLCQLALFLDYIGLDPTLPLHEPCFSTSHILVKEISAGGVIYQFQFKIKLISELLKLNIPSTNSMSEKLLFGCLDSLFGQNVSFMPQEDFDTRMDTIGQSAFAVFMQVILTMVNRKVLLNCQVLLHCRVQGHLLRLIIGHLEKISFESLDSVAKILCSSSLPTEFLFSDLTGDSRKLFLFMCQRFFSHDFLTVPVYWLRMFVFINDAEKLLAKIFSFSSPEAGENSFVKNLLASKDIQRDSYFTAVKDMLMDHQRKFISNSRRRHRFLDTSSESTDYSAAKKVKIEAAPEKPAPKKWSFTEGCVVF
jgi:hypothetical protein